MKFIKENLALIIALVGASATLGARLLKVDEKVFYNLIILITFSVVLLALWYRTRQDRSKGQKPVYTLITSKQARKQSAKAPGAKAPGKSYQAVGAWRAQARFNRLTALTAITLLLTSLVIIYIQYQNAPRENYKLLQDVYTVVAKHTKEDYEGTITHSSDDKLNVSYWVYYTGTAYPVGTTQGGSSDKKWGPNEPSIIGCAFVQPNRTVQWDDTMARPSVLSLNGEPSPDDPKCQYGKQEQQKLTSIVCASYAEDPEYSVGVCVFTENKDNKLSDKPTNFLKKRAREFYQAIFPLISEKKLIPTCGVREAFGKCF